MFEQSGRASCDRVYVNFAAESQGFYIEREAKSLACQQRRSSFGYNYSSGATAAAAGVRLEIVPGTDET